MLKTEAIKDVLRFSSNKHLTDLYNYNMEVQVNVAKDDGERVSNIYKGKRWTGWQKNGETWKSFRIPWNANSNPQYEDSNINFNLANHVEGIGLTGWDWVNHQSLWVGFDFDSIINHKSGLSDQELSKIKELLFNIPYVTLIKSTSGKGIHVYIFLEPVKTNNHTEHAALARSILTLLSKEIGQNLDNSVDTCGMVLWIYHRKQEGTDGLSLIKQGTKLDKIPSNWREHINVTSKKTKRISIDFDDSTIKYIPLNEDHKNLLTWFKKAKHDNWWDSDHNMLVCHTLDLVQAHKDLKLRGIFLTNSSGSSSQNCFAFPLADGSWSVRRHGKGVKEHESWTTDGSGWTHCLFNSPISFETSAIITGGHENSHGEYIFPTGDCGLNSIFNLGLSTVIPDQIKNRPISIKEKGDRLILTIDKEKSDPQIEGFISNKRGNKWEKVLKYDKPKKEVSAPDNLIRHVISSGVDAGWYINVHGQWILHNKSNAMTVLLGETENYKHFDIEVMMSESILNPWELVNIPFAEEYPGNRKWNKDSACFYHEITDIQDTFDTWLDLFNHIGKNLTSSVIQDSWCIENAIKSGGEYLLLWFANMCQRPNEPLPYLFLIGEQNTGKSTLHEAIGQFILKRGYSRADNALINPQGFNAEIANAILCVVEETDLRRNKDAANRLKDWVTGKTIQVNQKYKTPYDINNTTHWIQCANDILYCPVFPGDTRIVAIYVDMPEKEIPKDQLFSKLNNESKAFLSYLMKLELPPMPGRLSVPCLQTEIKNEIQLDNMNELEIFVKTECCQCDGNLIEMTEFHNKFQSWLPIEIRQVWTLMKTSRNFPKIYCKGRQGANNQTYVANIKMLNDKIDPQQYIWKVNHENGRLEQIWKQ